MKLSGHITSKANDVKIDEPGLDAHERGRRVQSRVKETVEDLACELGGYLAVSVHGYVNEDEGSVGDNINIQLSSLRPPEAPAQDAGLEAALSSPRNYPPEASTAAPATEDESPPAAQEPIPQPLQEDQGVQAEKTQDGTAAISTTTSEEQAAVAWRLSDQQEDQADQADQDVASDEPVDPTQFTKEELLAAAEEQGVEVSSSDTKAFIAEKLTRPPSSDSSETETE